MKRKHIYSIIAVVCLALTALIYFFPDDIEGNTLQQHDMLQGAANGQEALAFNEATGETTRWTNSLFSGMPNFQIAPSYPAGQALTWIGKAYQLWLPEPANLLFAMMFGFFIMCLCFRFKWYNALLASVAWGFSSYFIIIIGAGHIWKFVTLAYIPPTIGGIALCYRGKYLKGTALAALFGALQLQSNHPQMSYYFVFVIFAMMMAWLYTAIREKKTGAWAVSTACVVLAGVLAVAANSPSLYNSYEYAKETVRGRATDLSVEGKSDTGGMDRDAITAWSYGVDETLTFLVPNVKGGATIIPVAGQTQLLSLAQTEKADELSLAPEERQFLGQFPQYFGNQPMTNGPVYAGIVVLILAIIALFVVDSPMKWALFAISVLALALSWGHNFPVLTNLFIDHFPGYNKFRAVSSILVIEEFTIPLLAVMCLRKILDTPDFMKRFAWVVYGVTGITALVCFIGWVSPSVFGEPFSVSELEYLGQAGAFANPAYYNVIDAIRQTRLSLVSHDSLRSLCFILLDALIFFLYFKKVITNKAIFVCMLTVVVLLDLFTLGKRYVNTDNFVERTDATESFVPTAADEVILRDTAMNYRVMDIPGMGSARSSYFHKTIGGYHAAKLTRYNDLLDHQINRGNQQVLNMLNARYFITADSVIYNPEANGNAWFVEELRYVDNADAEMSALDNLDTRRAAVADKSFASTLGSKAGTAPGDTIFETSYAPNRLSYHARSAKGGVAVFSEVYFPWGWKAEIDGKEAQIARADYVLRALNVPAGEHTIVFTFDPQSLKVTNTISVVAVVLIYLLLAGAVAAVAVPLIRRKKNQTTGK